MNKIPLSRVFLNDEIREAAMQAVNSGSYILGPECRAFEEELARYVGMEHCVLSSSWTAAVMLLHQAMGVSEGDEIIIPSHTAFPSVEPLIHCGAKPVFVDVDESYCLDPDAVEAAVTPRTVGILPVHLYGHPADMDRLMAIAERHKLWVMEDCAQAHGARYRGRRVGSIGTASAFSFYPSKNLTVMGDGGCIMTNDAQVAEKVRMLRNHGRKSKFTHEIVGYNLRFNEIQAAIGRVMLRHLDTLNAHRREVAALYDERLAGLVETPREQPWAESVYHMYVIRSRDRDALGAWLKEQGIATGIHYPVANHRQPAITGRYTDLPRLPRTEALVEEILSLPIYGELPLTDVDRVCGKIAEYRGSR
ncbi:dTDP-3-amino-3,6-dideoxy-alpha-D-galactopyranose transaminase [bacterium BMS3Bbin12]|nr:dTDP-3-amino-3,6-dideoxy-alpha-D-galactopyranose transaminase [bacterium BMS3Abin12]GBE47849.1 dTDP-3-amino-3,6-dideoxy-alpha-D-galactopyranose transaminase [bacterium BMS3Bbin12]GBE51096.1 dTDP-3-amino-3,6-dideoxy-alpha-D-galactopyranose transaminase [bacterium BMS3Bbin13]HDJ86621.1 DegT/DnrJ/EryC1/StrS family aminotransferase [Chromatiales bacterium]HDK02574.1 DegT/DnrJ/EryC1/StrS family aminotransferase [Gammaproteobacteria bacterium]